MAGKLRFAAKLFLATTVLAAGGTGAYYGTTMGWPTMKGFVPAGIIALDKDASDPRSKGTTSTAADLDAVASAWGEPAHHHRTPEDSSATARTADVAVARPQTAVQTNDRYGLASEPVASVSAAAVNPVPNVPQPAPAKEVESLPAEPVQQEPTDDGAEKVADAEPSPELARGQEPKEESTPQQPAEPQPIEAADQEQRIDSPEAQARDAFRDQPAQSADDRYSAAAAPPTEPSIVNPFNSKSPSGAPAASAPETIEPLPALSNEIGGPRRELQQNGEIQPLDRGNRTARGATNTTTADLYRAQGSRKRDEALNAEFSDAASGPSNLPGDVIGQSPAGDGTGKPGERALEGPQRPALEIQKFAPGEIQVGKPAKFVVQIRNVGSQPADGVIVHDEIPQGTRLISTSPSAQSDGSQLAWELGKLSPGEDRKVEMQIMPTAEGEIGSVATVSYSAQASVKTRCTMPQLAIRMTAPGKVMIGQEQRVKIELRNPGSGDATGVMLLENVPQNVRHAAGPALEFEIGMLRAGETRELELVLLAEKAGKTVNVLTARADGNLQVQQQMEFEVIAPELTVDLDGPERRYLERPATYEVRVENPGTAPAHDVKIITKLPKGMQFVRANNMGEYDAATHAVYWSLAELPEGERGTVELVTMPIETGSQTLEVESRAGQGLSDQTQRQIVVDGLAAIMFEVRDLEDPIEVGGETGYEIRVVNQGTKEATNLQVAINLPPGMQLVSAEGETQHESRGGAIVFEPIAQLAPKADTVYRVRVQGTQAGDQRVTVEVNTDDLTQPIRREESTRVFGDE